MIDYYTALIYGIIQGITEFLPISSSGHLAILPKILKFNDPGITFDLAMHVGTALAVIIYYFKEIKNLIFSLFNPRKSDSRFYFALNMLFSTFISVLLIFLIKGLAETHGRRIDMIGFNLIIFGVLMFLADKKIVINHQTNRLDQRNLVFAGIIGLAQALAVFPGVSRSGITLTAGRFLGLSREQATQYSFLMSVPIIIGGFIFKLKELDQNVIFDIPVLCFGIFISFIVGLLTIHFFLKFIKNFGLLSFSIYRLILGSLLFLL